ncbi:MAG: hypothetical protein PUE97_00780 [Subdoligranulum variabile]|nr:hypothetical protein [Subdoligranulum variabile]
MYSVPDDYQTAIRAPTRTDGLAGRLTLADGGVIPLDDSAVLAGSVCVDNQCVTGQELAFGGVYMGQASLQLRTELSSAAFYDAALEIDYKLRLPDGSWYTLPVGRYTVAEAERSAAVVSLTAYDHMLKLERPLAGSVIQGDAYAMLTQIAETCGVELGQTEAEIRALSPNAELLRQLDAGYHVSTWRDCAGAVAQLLAGFATFDRLGRLVVRQFGGAPCATLGENARTNAKISDFSCHYAALTIETDDDSYTAGTEGDSGLAMTIADMPLAESGLPSTKQGICDALFARLQNMDYTPMTVTLPGDPALELGDRLTVPTKDGAPQTLVTHLVWKFRGTQTLKGVGKNPYLTGTTRTDTRLRSLQKQTAANKVIYYSFSNGSDLVVRGDGAEISAANLTFVTTQNTSAMFLAQLLLTAEPETETVDLPVTSTDETLPTDAAAALERDAALTLTVRYYMDDSLIGTYVPTQRLVRGSHALALFYPFPDLQGAASHRWSVRLLCTGGVVRIGKGQLRATITGQGMAAGDIWDGTLTLEETLARVTRPANLRQILAIYGDVTTEMQRSLGSTAAELLARIPRTTPRRAVNGQAPKRSTTYAYYGLPLAFDANFVQLDAGGWQLRTSWQYDAVPQEIDTGTLLCAAADTGNLAEVSKIEVSI